MVLVQRSDKGNDTDDLGSWDLKLVESRTDNVIILHKKSVSNSRKRLTRCKMCR